eukprot:s363_g4.t1
MGSIWALLVSFLLFLAPLVSLGILGLLARNLRKYDFLYLPIDFDRKANLGYAFEDVDDFWSTFDGFGSWSFPSSKVCQVSWSGPKQGLKAHVDRYKNRHPETFPSTDYSSPTPQKGWQALTSNSGYSTLSRTRPYQAA